VDPAQEVALFYALPIALWLSLLLILLRTWTAHRLEESLAYLIYIRERKLRFVLLFAGVALTQIVNATNRLLSIFLGLSGPGIVAVSITAEAAGGLLVALIGWNLLWQAPRQIGRETVLDVSEPMAYALGVVDRAERGDEVR
jgi:hypothetical protein